tara:strand:- start:472 stop:1356 length:885 start_codon:yes stop_codon:yes gene_type:complete
MNQKVSKNIDKKEYLCKICGSSNLLIFENTAKCKNCGILLYYPYPKKDEDIINSGEKKDSFFGEKFDWYAKSSFFNHINFTNMLRYTINKSYTNKEFNILDFGGGGGQFALICKSHFPKANIYITDIDDDTLLNEWAQYNNQISALEFTNNTIKFDFIFMNDVFEHLSCPEKVLLTLSEKLRPNGKIFIDTPRQFWIYRITKLLSKNLYKKLLKANVSLDHLQIWSYRSFRKCILKSNLSISKYKEVAEFTMEPEFYLDNMDIKSGFLRYMGKIFYKITLKFLKNKIMCVLEKN